MKITFCTPRFYPAISGGEFYILKLMETLQQRYQDQVQIICTDSVDFAGLKKKSGRIIEKSSKYYQNYRKIPIHRYSLDYSYLESDATFNSSCNWLFKKAQDVNIEITRDEIQAYLGNGLNLNNEIPTILKINAMQNLDLIHTTFLPYSILLYALLLAKSKGIPSVCTPFYHIFNPRYNDINILKILKQFDALIACTETEKQALIGKGCAEEKIEVIPMGVDYKLYNKTVKSNSGRLKSFRSEFGIEKPFILYVGFKNHEKGALSVLQASKIVSKKYPELRYVFIGPTTHAFDSELKKSREEGVNILNITPGNMRGYFDWRKISAFQECEFFVMPSRSDAYGMVYLEAWAAGKAVIGAKNPVMEEVIQDNIDGLLVEFDNYDEIASAIIKLIEDKQLRKSLGSNGNNKVKKMNEWDLITSQTRELYKSLI